MNKQNLIEGLNEDLAGELGTIVRYIVQSSKAHGPHGAEIRDLLSGEIEDEIGHARFLADVIYDLGGEPTTSPQPFKNRDSLSDMLALDIEMEEQDVANYKDRAELAEKLDNIELKVRLEDMAADESRHARQLRRLAQGL